MSHRILFTRIENSYHDSSRTFQYKNLNSPPFYPFSFNPPLKNRNLHEEESILCLWRADWPAYLVHSRLKTRPLHAEMDCLVHVSHPLSEGMASLEMEEERIEQSSFLFFFHDRVLYQCSRHKVSHRSTRIPNYAIEDASLSSRDCTIDYNC